MNLGDMLDNDNVRYFGSFGIAKNKCLIWSMVNNTIVSGSFKCPWRGAGNATEDAVFGQDG